MMKSPHPEIYLLLALALITGVLVDPAGISRRLSVPAVDLPSYPWLYLRDGQPVTYEGEDVSLIVVGDVLLGRGVAEVPDPLGGAAPWLRRADLVMGNLESAVVGEEIAVPVIPSGGPQPIILNSPLTAPAALRAAGFDILGLANNHSLDYGSVGLAETGSRLEQAGLLIVGAGPDIEATYQPVFVDVRGLRLAFFAFNTIGSAQSDPAGWARADWDEMRATQTVALARAQSDAVVVLMHWGEEYFPRSTPTQQSIAQALRDAGADLIVGSHPHVVQGVEVGDEGLIAYSLGNFAFDQDEQETTRGLALRALFDAHGLRAVQALPITAERHPHLLSVSEAEALLSRVQPPPRRIGFACNPENCQPAEVPQTPTEGVFWSGVIDLTGNGVPEIVRREGEQVKVFQEGQMVYETPPEWRVVDVALGDPNDDGRGELMLAIWQADANGVEWSQPYIVGYRGGEYRLLWGGRPVFDPIQEIEVGDVDGDGVDELVVLETRKSGKQAVSIWRWVAWGFGFVWRSQEDRCKSLTLVTGESEQPPLISVAIEP